MGEFQHARNMPKLKRENGEEHATDFVESLDRGLPLLQKFGRQRSDDAKRSRPRRGPAARHRATHSLRARARRLCRNRRQAVHADARIAAINMGAHADRVSTGEMMERFLPRLREGADSVKSMLL